MDRHDDDEIEPDRDVDSTVHDGESHATTGGAAAAGAVTGGVIGLTGGPLGAAIGAIGGAIVGVAAERMMHGEDAEASVTAEDSEPTSDMKLGRTDVQLEPPPAEAQPA